MLLHMQKYDYTIWYKPSKDMVLSNHLSHFPSHSNYLPIPIAHNVWHVQLSNAELDIIQGSVEHDPMYSSVYHLTFWGWPEHQQEVPHIARHFWVWRTNCPSILVYSSSVQEYVFLQSSSIVPLLICMGPIRVSIGCRHRWGRQCIGLA